MTTDGAGGGGQRLIQAPGRTVGLLKVLCYHRRQQYIKSQIANHENFQVEKSGLQHDGTRAGNSKIRNLN
jgi:hypothetical protein